MKKASPCGKVIDMALLNAVATGLLLSHQRDRFSSRPNAMLRGVIDRSVGVGLCMALSRKTIMMTPI